MTDRRYLRVSLVLLSLVGASHAADLNIYRCTDGQGHLTVRDSPCTKGERQEVRTMVQPQDPPHREPAVQSPPPATIAPPPAITRIVTVTPLRPLYECYGTDGVAYLSDTDQVEPRWESAWPYGFVLHSPGGHRRRDHRRDGFPVVARPRTLDGRVPSGLVFDNVGRPTPKPPRDRPGVPSVPLPPSHGHGLVGFEAGAWVRDQCHQLPQAEVCARLRDRRYELDRRYNSALQSERSQITQEQRGIDARLAADCGGN